MRRWTWKAWAVASWMAVGCGPKLGAHDPDSAPDDGLIDGGGDVGTGNLPEPGDDRLPDDYDPFDCVDSLLLGQADATIHEIVDDPDACLACAPAGTCTSDDDCADGARCDYTVERPGPGHCIRECTDHTDCDPDSACLGFAGRQGDRIQLCGVRSNDAWLCASFDEPQPCRSRTDAASCEALVSAHPRDVRCAWVEERIVANANTCLAIGAEGRCEPTLPVDGSGGALYWRDYGAGTVGLFAAPEGRRLMSHPGGDPPFATCDLSGSVPLPNVCACPA